MNQLGAIVEGDHRDLADGPVLEGSLRHPGSELLQTLLHALDDSQRVVPVARDHDPTDDLRAGVVQPAPATGGAEVDVGHVSNPDGRVLALDDDHLLEVVERLDEADPADDVLDVVDLHRAGADVDVRLTDRVGDLSQRDPVGAHRVGIDVDLVLLDEAADRGDLADPVDRLQGVANGPVLDAPELVEVPAAGRVAVGVAPLERVPEDLPEGGGVGAEGGSTPSGSRFGGSDASFSSTRERDQ